MLSFHDGIVSYHRGLYMDLDTRCLLSGVIPEIQEKQRKKVNTKHKKQAREFKDKVNKAIEANQLEQRTENLLKMTVVRHKIIKEMQIWTMN
eukprot:13266750-Ditylum_brightwellii.AAC.1